MNSKYALKENGENINWIPIVENMGYFWSLPLTQIRIHIPKYNKQESIFESPNIIATTIQLPVQ